MKHALAALALSLATVTSLGVAPAYAQDDTADAATASTPVEMRADQVVALINGELDAPFEEVFTPQFLASVPPAQLEAISGQLTTQFGKAISVESVTPPEGPRSALAVRLERAIAKGGIVVDPAQDNKISELLFQTFEPIGDTAEKITADLEALPGEVSVWFSPIESKKAVFDINADEPMAIGSTFKLYVLAALAEQVATGERSWGDTVSLDTKSFPSGMMQDWPKGAPVTLHTLASMMISLSDNTATDMLIKELGKDVVFDLMTRSGHNAPELNTPFMTTRELFLLKGGDRKRVEAYRAADTKGRAAILAGLETNAPGMDQIQAAFSGGPNAIDIEWMASTVDLANLLTFMRWTADDEAFRIMAINPSITNDTRANWSYAGYKGGSEPGVLNLTWLLTDLEGREHILSISWNNHEANLDNSALELIAQRILSLPR